MSSSPSSVTSLARGGLVYRPIDAHRGTEERNTLMNTCQSERYDIPIVDSIDGELKLVDHRNTI